MAAPDAGRIPVAAAHWRCRFCGTVNPGDAGRCRSCGASRGAAATAVDASVARAPAPASAARRSGRARTLAGIALVAAVLGAATVYLARRPDAEAVTVAGFEWERTVEVEERATVREESWKEDVPEGARIIARRREVHHVERRQVGTRDGQPVYREQRVYGQRVAYDVDRWSVARTLRSSGKDKSPRWPDIRLNLGEREGKRGESYVVVLQGQGRQVHRVRVPRERWLEMREGQIGTAVMGKDGALLELR
jgi:hypothetical protein